MFLDLSFSPFCPKKNIKTIKCARCLNEIKILEVRVGRENFFGRGALLTKAFPAHLLQLSRFYIFVRTENCRTELAVLTFTLPEQIRVCGVALEALEPGESLTAFSRMLYQHS